LAPVGPAPSVNESFLLLFFKKEALSFFCLLHSVAAGLAGKSRMPAFAGMTRNAG
jgi:hypothetical protein